MIKFIHAADVHLDSPLRGLERYEDAPTDRIRKATRRAFENLVNLAIEEKVDFVLIAGDLYDGDWKDYNTGLFFVSNMARLNRAGIEVFIVEGNHDAASKMTRSLPFPENVKTFPKKKPGTHLAAQGQVAIHGQGFASSKVTTELWRDYPEAEPNLFNIGLLHTSLNGRPGHEHYAPCTASDLRSKNYDYWALGHIHAQEIVSEDPWIVFPGNIQGRHIRETGSKGCFLVTLRDDDVVLEERELDVLRWSLCEVDVTGVERPEDVLERIEEALTEEISAADDRVLAVRIHVVGSCGAHGQLLSAPERWIEQIRGLGPTVGGDDLWIEKVKFKTERERSLEEALGRDDALGGLLKSIHRLDTNGEQQKKLSNLFEGLRRKLPAELFTGHDPFDPTAPESLKDPLEEAKELLLSRLLPVTDEREQ